MKYIANKNKTYAVSLLVVSITLIVQIFILPLLPEKYFFDSNNILKIVDGQNTNVWNDKSFIFVSEIFKSINIFNITTFTGWAIPFSIIGALILLAYFNNYKNYSIHELLIISIAIVFSNIYLFRISKDIIQWIFWLLITICLINYKNRNSIIVISLLFIFESLLFRAYYIGILILAILILATNNVKNKKKLYKAILALGIVSIIGLLVLDKVDHQLYLRIINIRTTLNQSRLDDPNAVTAINDIIRTDNIFTYLINQIINIARYLFPIELFTKGIMYWPFIYFQAYITVSIIKNLKRNNTNKDKRFMTIQAICLSFIIISAIFEPDFGSVIRHEAAAFPIIFAYIYYEKIKDKRPLVKKYENIEHATI